MFFTCMSFYVNKLIKAEAESFLESFFLDYPIYIYIYGNHKHSFLIMVAQTTT